MNYARFVCLITFTLLLGCTSYLAAQTAPMTKGVHVQMAKTANATAVPEADNEDAWVVTISSDGQIYFGVKRVMASELFEQMKAMPRQRDQNLYIKSDARSEFENVERVLSAARTDFFSAPVLLTNQGEVPALGKLVAPKGLRVFLGDPRPDAVSVEILRSGQSAPEVMVDHQPVHLPDLQMALNQVLQQQKERTVTLTADGQLPFAQVAQIIDVCTSVQAKVILPIPTL